MAEAIVNDRLSETWEAVSVNALPTGYVHPKVISILAEYDIQHLRTITHDGKNITGRYQAN
jgi:hypothetical protein